jgi:hypothetical protein
MRTLAKHRIRIKSKSMEGAMTRSKQTGSVLVFLAFAMVVLLGFAGLAIDMGTLRYQKRLQQTAADAAAIAGASNLAAGGVTAGGRDAAATNGFTNNGGNVANCKDPGAAVGTICVEINNPPTSGQHPGNALYVEAFVSVVQPTYFMKVLGINKQAITARAVATNLGGGINSGCLYTLGAPSASIEGVNINGSATLNAPTCGIVDNGNFNTQGNALVVNAATFGMSGSRFASGPGGTVTCSVPTASCPTPSMPAAADPLSYLTPPCSPCTATGSIDINGGNGSSFTVNPGTYSSISLRGTGNGPAITFTPGIYVVTGPGNFTVAGNAAITGNGVMFYFTNNATIDATGGGNKLDFQLSPPTSGPYAGILFYQNPADTAAPSLGGDNNSSFSGALYFPKVQLTFFGNSTSYNTGIIVADAISLSGNPTINLLGTAGLPPGVTVIKNAILVE